MLKFPLDCVLRGVLDSPPLGVVSMARVVRPTGRCLQANGVVYARRFDAPALPVPAARSPSAGGEG